MQVVQPDNNIKSGRQGGVVFTILARKIFRITSIFELFAKNCTRFRRALGGVAQASKFHVIAPIYKLFRSPARLRISPGAINC